jgi:hypothetical protein
VYVAQSRRQVRGRHQLRRAAGTGTRLTFLRWWCRAVSGC